MHEPNESQVDGTGLPPTELPPGVDPEAPPHAIAAATAYLAELDDLLAHVAAHPGERWVAYRWGTRVAIGSDRGKLEQECLERFPDRKFNVYGIDGAVKYRHDTVF